MSDNTNVNNLAPLESVHDLQTLEAAFEASGQVVRKNLEDGFLGDLVSAEHVYRRKCDEERLFKCLERYLEWLKTLKISPRTARRMCAFYLDLKINRPEILKTVNLLYLKNVTSTALQVLIKLDEDKKNGVYIGEYLRYECKFEGIFLYFKSTEDFAHDLVDLSSRQITLLAFPEKAPKAAVDSVDSEKSPSPSYTGAQGSAVVEGTDDKDQEIQRWKQRCKVLEEAVRGLETELAAYQDAVPRAQFDELKEKFAQYLQKKAPDKRTKPVDEREIDIPYDEDELFGENADIDAPGFTYNLDSVLAA